MTAMGNETRLEQLTKRTYRIRLERPRIRESRSNVPAPVMRVAPTTFATRVHRGGSHALSPEEEGRG